MAEESSVIHHSKRGVTEMSVENKDFDAIMREITSGMKGNPREDMAYLEDS